MYDLDRMQMFIEMIPVMEERNWCWSNCILELRGLDTIPDHLYYENALCEFML